MDLTPVYSLFPEYTDYGISISRTKELTLLSLSFVYNTDSLGGRLRRKKKTEPNQEVGGDEVEKWTEKNTVSFPKSTQGT